MERASDTIFSVDPQTINKEQEKSQNVVIMETSLREMFSKKNLTMKTDLSNTQIVHMTRGYILVKRTASQSMLSLLNYIEELSVSKDRKGRQEMTSIIQAAANQNNNEDEDSKWWQKYISR